MSKPKPCGHCNNTKFLPMTDSKKVEVCVTCKAARLKQ